MRTCNELEPFLAAYVDGVLEAAEREKVEQHLESCPMCKEQVSGQKALKSLLHERYRTEVTPVHVRARIRRALAEKPRVPGFFEMLFEAFTLHKVKSAVALITLMFFVSYPYVRSQMQPGARPSGFAATGQQGELQPVEMVGEVLCVDCELLHEAHLPAKHEPDHRLGIRTADGRIWNLVPSGPGKTLLHNDALMNKKVRIKGRRYSSGSYISVEQYNQI